MTDEELDQAFATFSNEEKAEFIETLSRISDDETASSLIRVWAAVKILDFGEKILTEHHQ